MIDESDEMTVMVVDDHPIWREGVARDLRACWQTFFMPRVDRLCG
jgi:hypothetical protein